MTDNNIIIGSDGIPRSSMFDDIYYSIDNGFEESKYVFFKHADIEKKVITKDITICEFGFGTGLNFISTWYLWKQMPKKNKITYIAFEKYPISKEHLSKTLGNFPHLSSLYAKFLTQYNSQTDNCIEFENRDVSFRLYIGDINQRIKELKQYVDAWYLDGFAPSKNFSMWNQGLYNQMAKLSNDGASFSTFTAASNVRKGLEKSGFEIKKAKGFGRKREMLYGLYKSQEIHSWYDYAAKKEKINTIAVIGGGVAGVFAAYYLAEAGMEVTLLDKESDIMQGASGNEVGMLYPRVELGQSHIGYFYLKALEHVTNFLKNTSALIEGKHYSLCGLLQLAKNQDDNIRLQKISDNYSSNVISYIDNTSLCDAIGNIGKDNNGALHFPTAGWVVIKDICSELVKHNNIQVLNNFEVNSLDYDDNIWSIKSIKNEIKVDGVVIANSFCADSFEQVKHLDLTRVKGQIDCIKPDNITKQINKIICYGGYVTPTHSGFHHIGATYDYGDESIDTSAISSKYNLDLLSKNLGIQGKSCSARASVRCYSDDYMPIIGQVPKYNEYIKLYAGLKHGKQVSDIKPIYEPNLYVNIAHGARGFLSAPHGAYLLAQMICNNHSIDDKVNQFIHPARFIISNLKKNKL